MLSFHPNNRSLPASIEQMANIVFQLNSIQFVVTAFLKTFKTVQKTGV